MSPLIESLSVRGFRSLSKLSIDGLGRVNLFTGRNNSGKSSLLEAIRILTSGGSPRIIYEILESREEIGSSQRIQASEVDTSICSLFNGFPAMQASSEGFGISTQGNLPLSIKNLDVRLALATRIQDPETQITRYEISPKDLFDDSDNVPVIEILTPLRRRLIPVQRLSDRMLSRSSSASEYFDLPCVYLSPFSSRSSSQMGVLWDAVALTDIEEEIVLALKIIAPEVAAISMIGDESRGRKGRIAIVKSSKHLSPVPLRSFGDGVNRIFSTILSLANARGGILLTDEIENGIHYTAQEEFWKIIFKLASQLDVQVFATTHSWDCIAAFQRAAQESPEDGVLVRLRQKDGAVHSTSFSENELRIVTRDRIEVR